MPTYEYICKQCGHLFEIVQSMKDDTLTECPQCGGELRKVFAPPAIAFKGSGFYATDHGKKAKPAPSDTKKEGSSGAGESKKPEKKSETKSDTSSTSTTPTGSNGSSGSSGSSGSDAKG
jgi:putative FmdB family regulatory protein